MARIRSIKPEFWTSEQVASCSRSARLLFIGMWNFCDDAGIHPRSYMRLKMEVLPGDDCSEDEIKIWVAELVSAGLLIEYNAEGKDYWMVSGWKHQKIDRPTYKYPRSASYCPNGSKHDFVEHSTKDPQLLVEQSSNDRQPLTPGREWNGKGREKDICKVSSETSPPSFCENELPSNIHEPEGPLLNNEHENNNKPQPLTGSHIKDPENSVLEVFTYWQAKMNHPRAILDKKRKVKIQAAFKLGFTIEQLKQAIEGCAYTPFNMGQNKAGQRYDSIDLIFRDAEHIEQFMQNAPANCAETSLDLTVRKIDQIAEGAI